MINIPLKGVLRKPTMRLAPATLAILIQIVAAIAVFFSIIVVSVLFAVRVPFVTLVILQSVYAVALCALAKMDVWWRWIHGVFPIAMFAMAMLTIPNEVYLVGFLVTLSIFWTTFRSQVPFFPSRPSVREKVAQLIPLDKTIRMIDIGSGLGDLSMHIANVHPNSQVEGIEIAPMPWLVSHMRAWMKRSSARFTLGDYHTLDFAQYNLVFAYLSPAAMPALWQKAQQEMQAGSLLVSYEFPIPNAPATYTIQDAVHPTLYVWEL